MPFADFMTNWKDCKLLILGFIENFLLSLIINLLVYKPCFQDDSLSYISTGPLGNLTKPPTSSSSFIINFFILLLQMKRSAVAGITFRHVAVKPR